MITGSIILTTRSSQLINKQRADNSIAVSIDYQLSDLYKYIEDIRL